MSTAKDPAVRCKCPKMSGQPQPVQLYVYDLTSGMAALISPAILGTRIEGVWHTSIVVYDREFFYGAGGVTSCAPGGTALGQPLRIEALGDTHIPYTVFIEYLQGLGNSTFAGSNYHLLEHNCNHFTDEVAAFTCGVRIPKQYVQQQHALPPPLRSAVVGLLESLVPNQQQAGCGGVRRLRHESPDYLQLNTSIEEARPPQKKPRISCSPPRSRSPPARQSTPTPTHPSPRHSWRSRLRRGGALLAMVVHAVLHPYLFDSNPPTTDNNERAVGAALGARRDALAEKLARKQRRKEKKQRKGKHENSDQTDLSSPIMAEALAESPGAAGLAPEAEVDEPDARTAAEMKRRQQFPPIVFTDIDGSNEFDQLTKSLEPISLSEPQLQSLDELRQYLVGGEGSWVLGDDFFTLIGQILREESLSVAREPLLRCLAAAALREDISLVLHQDRKEHALVTHAHAIDRLPHTEQTAILLFMCNLFSSISGSEWLLYISEWEHNGQQISNIKTTTKVCVHGVLSEDPVQRDIGTGLLYNLAAKEVKTVRLRETRPLRDLLPKHARAKVFDEVCAELALAALQLAGTLAGNSGDNEPFAWRALWALARLVHHSADVPQLVAMVGPDPNMFRGMSSRIDEQIDIIMQRVK